MGSNKDTWNRRKIIESMKTFCEKSKAQIIVKGEKSEVFRINVGVR